MFGFGERGVATRSIPTFTTAAIVRNKIVSFMWSFLVSCFVSREGFALSCAGGEEEEEARGGSALDAGEIPLFIVPFRLSKSLPLSVISSLFFVSQECTKSA